MPQLTLRSHHVATCPDCGAVLRSTNPLGQPDGWARLVDCWRRLGCQHHADPGKAPLAEVSQAWQEANAC